MADLRQVRLRQVNREIGNSCNPTADNPLQTPGKAGLMLNSPKSMQTSVMIFQGIR
jgi:hypothetical protein